MVVNCWMTSRKTDRHKTPRHQQPQKQSKEMSRQKFTAANGFASVYFHITSTEFVSRSKHFHDVACLVASILAFGTRLLKEFSLVTHILAGFTLCHFCRPTENIWTELNRNKILNMSLEIAFSARVFKQHSISKRFTFMEDPKTKNRHSRRPIDRTTHNKSLD